MTSLSEKRAIFGAYYFALAALLVASFLPDYRIWGITGWAYLPLWGRWVLFGVGATMPILIHIFEDQLPATWNREDSEPHYTKNLNVVVVAVALILPVLFYLFRSKTFFLGDGYAYLSLLGNDIPLVKYRDLGEALAHIELKRLLGLKGEPGALITFQIISIAAGVLYFLINVWGARKLYVDGLHRAIFTLFMMSIGPMLLFFGYVENYSLFICSTTLFALGGLLVSMGKLRRTILIPLTILPCFFHIFGVCLIPPALYAAISGGAFGNRLARTNWKTKGILVFLLGTIGSVLFLWIYSNNYFFRFAIIPPIPDRFTVEGYWLLAPSHFADFINIMLLHTPSFLLTMVVVCSVSLRRLLEQREYRFLGLLVISTLAAAFIFDPKLGMPRDWDLFSFIGIPLALISIRVILDIRVRSVHYKTVALLSVTLGFLVLSGRVTTLAIPEYGVAQFNNYASLDKTKNMYGRTMLLKYYEQKEDSAAIERERQRYLDDFPERSVNHQGIKLMNRREYVSAMQLFREVLKINPVFSAAYSNLGECYQSFGQLDNAIEMFRISAGLNPYNAMIATKLAGACVAKGELEKAEEHLEWASKIGPKMVDPLLGLMIVYERQGRTEERWAVLTRLAALPNAPVKKLAEAAELHLDRMEFSQAGDLLERALARGLDSAYVARLIRKYPSLKGEIP